MSDEPLEMPSEGGCYTRTPKGALRRVEQPTADAPPPPVEPPGDPVTIPETPQEA